MIHGIKVLVMGLIASLPELVNVALFLAFIIMIFTIFGIQFFQGALEQRCRISPLPINNTWLINESIQNICGWDNCPNDNVCGNPSEFGLSQNWTEVNTKELLWGIPNFNTFYNGSLTIFQTLTPVGWYKNMSIVSYFIYLLSLK